MRVSMDLKNRLGMDIRCHFHLAQGRVAALGRDGEQPKEGKQPGQGRCCVVGDCFGSCGSGGTARSP